MQSTARGTDVRRRGSASAIQHLADRTFGKVAELSSQVTEDVETALIAVIVASEIRLPDHPEDRAIRVSSINAWTAGATSIYISTSSWEAPHAHLLSRVTWVDETDVPPETPSPQFWRLLRCWRLVQQDEERRLQRHHDWYFRPRLDFQLPLPTVRKLRSEVRLHTRAARRATRG